MNSKRKYERNEKKESKPNSIRRKQGYFWYTIYVYVRLCTTKSKIKFTVWNTGIHSIWGLAQVFLLIMVEVIKIKLQYDFSESFRTIRCNILYSLLVPYHIYMFRAKYSEHIPHMDIFCSIPKTKLWYDPILYTMLYTWDIYFCVNVNKCF